MDNIETQATLGTIHRTDTKKTNNTTLRVNRGTGEGKTVSDSYKKPAVLLRKSSLVGDRGKKTKST
jgi:hypothetical protein